MKFSSLCLSAVLMLCPFGAALAHPHMFVDAQARLLSDDEGRLTGLSISMRVDELTTMFSLEENQIEVFDAPLTADQSAAVGAGLLEGLSYYDYFADLRLDGVRQSFTDVTVHGAQLEDFRLVATVELRLEQPQGVSGRDVEVALYDPTYYAAVATLNAPDLAGDFAQCSTRLVKFQPSRLDSATLFQLSALSREETPEDTQIGAQFADRGYVICAD